MGGEPTVWENDAAEDAAALEEEKPSPLELEPLGDPETINHRQPPMAYIHLCDIWKLMRDEARQASEGWVWEGSTTSLFDRLEKGRALYTQVMTRLANMGCVLQLRRGGGPQPSIWLIQKAPTLDDFYGSPQGRTTPKQQRGGTQGANASDVAQQLRDVNRRLQNVEEYLRTHDVPI
jgi:hypothetical protein